MGARQLYYTSCEYGMSGSGGYQFNAATPGVDAHVLREVERFTVYEPPRSLPPEEVHRHPVNLCYSPDLGGARVLSRVISSGHDPSGRPGNYFAHSLLLDGDGGPLPAELWGAGFWSDRPVADPDLPGLSLVPGPLDRTRTAAWLRGRDESLLRRLLMAVDSAIDGGAPVLLPARDEDAAHWVAALSHLLPPRRARRMSFATYSGNPEDVPVHVVAVPPDTDTCGLRDRFVVFGAARLGTGGPSDEDDESVSDEDRETDPDTHSVVSTVLLSGVEYAPRLWSAAEPYASGTEGSLSTWRPPLAASRLNGARGPVPESDLRVVHAWLPEAMHRLPAGLTRTLLDRLLDLDSDSANDDEPTRLQAMAHACGSWELIERAEVLLARRALDRIVSGAPAPPVAPLRSPRVLVMAGERVGLLLEDGAAGRALEPVHVVELLRWARTGGVSLSEAALERYGAGPLARALAERPPHVPLGRDLVELLKVHAPLRRGAARALAALPRRPLTALAAGPLGALFAADREASGAVLVLRELHLLHSGARDAPPPLPGEELLAARALATCPGEVFDAYHQAAAERLILPPRSILSRSVRPLEAELVARVFLTAHRLCEGGSADRGRSLLVDVLEPAALTWSRRHVAATRRVFDDPEQTRDFDRWVRGIRDLGGPIGLFRLRLGGNR